MNYYSCRYHIGIVRYCPRYHIGTGAIPTTLYVIEYISYKSVIHFETGTNYNWVKFSNKIVKLVAAVDK